MFKCFRRNKEITFNSLSTRKLHLTCFSVNLDILEKYVNGYYSRRGVLYGEGSYELVCDERSSFRTRLILQQRTKKVSCRSLSPMKTSLFFPPTQGLSR